MAFGLWTAQAWARPAQIAWPRWSADAPSRGRVAVLAYMLRRPHAVLHPRRRRFDRDQAEACSRRGGGAVVLGLITAGLTIVSPPRARLPRIDTSSMNRNEAFTLYKQMLLIRRFEERCAQLYVEGKIGGFLHLYIGQEAVGVGAMSLMRPDDYLITSYRDHGYALARGTDPRPLLAELCGKVSGISRAKGGSMHFYDVPRGNFGGDGIVGGHLPIAAGMGYSIRLRKTDQVVLCFFGDGAVNEGAFHEALNVSALWDLPVVYIIENNRYGMGTSLDRASSVKDLYQRGSAYGIPRHDVNGMDLVAVRTVLGEAIDLARKEKRPSLIEAETYRYRGHSMSDPGKYRRKEEVEEYDEVRPRPGVGPAAHRSRSASPGRPRGGGQGDPRPHGRCRRLRRAEPGSTVETLYEASTSARLLHAKSADKTRRGGGPA